MMIARKISNAVFGIVLFTVLAGCAQTGSQIGHTVHVCCPGNYDSYQSYGVTIMDIPDFLSSYVVAEFDRAFQEKGITRNDRQNQLAVTLSYRHINLNPDQENIDPFERHIQEDVTLRYAATIMVEMRETAGGRLVWSGQISHIHNVAPGEYMHEERARPEFANAFRAMLESYPSRN